MMNGHGNVRILSREDEPDITGWIIVFDGGESFLGKPIEMDAGMQHVLRLDPAYAVVGGWAGTPQGIIRQRAILPLELLSSARTLDILVPVRITHLDSLDDEDRASFVKAIKAAEDTRRTLRAQRSNIVIADGQAPVTRQ